jgi:hypothetical protein
MFEKHINKPFRIAPGGCIEDSVGCVGIYMGEGFSFLPIINLIILKF